MLLILEYLCIARIFHESLAATTAIVGQIEARPLVSSYDFTPTLHLQDKKKERQSTLFRGETT